MNTITLIHAEYLQLKLDMLKHWIEAGCGTKMNISNLVQ